jgi:cytochrome c-type biogenesis protein CcmH/NrfG
MDQALQIDPNHQKGLYNIGIMYMNIGKQDSTRKYWERLVTVFPESDEAKNAGEMLKKM